MSPDTSIARVEGARPPGRLDRSGPEMFGYFTGAAKKAVSRRGKEPHKFRIDVTIVAVSGLPVKVKAACVTLERGGKRHVSGITRSVDHPPGVARWPEGSTPLNFVATLYRDPDGKFERKAFTVKARAEELDPDATGYGKLKTFVQGAVDLSAFASGLENLTSGDGEGGSGELVEIGLNDAASKTKGVTATVRVSVVWVKNYAALDADQASYTSSAGVTVAPGEEGGESGASDVMSVSAAAREQDLTGFAIDSDSDSNAESNDSDSGDARRLKAILGDFKGSLRSQLLSPVKEASPSKELGTPLGTPAKPSLTHSGRIQVNKFEITDEDGGSDDESKSSPASSAASTPGKRKSMLNRTPVKTKSQAMWGNIRGRMNAAKAASALSGKSAKDSIASAFTKMDSELSLNKSASAGSEGSGMPLETVEWATVGTALGVASPNPSPAKEGDISNMTIENVEASSSFRTSSSEVGERVMHLGARRVSESTAQGGDASRELELTKVRLAAAETRARDAEREANELRLRMESRGETSSSTSSGIIRGLSEVATRAKEGPLANEHAGGDADTPGTRGSDHQGAFFTPAASADPTPTTTPKGRAENSKQHESKLKSDPPASPVRESPSEKPEETPPASPSTFASFFGFGESPSKPPNEETNKPPATEILAAASSSDDHSESGRDETETMSPLTDPAPVALTKVEDAGGTGRRLYDADEADGAMATLRTELERRSTQVVQLQAGVRRLMEQMSRVQSEKESVESVATDLTEKNASLQSKVIARVVHLMRNASTAKSFRTWRDVTQSEKISRAGAEKTAALMRASTDEFKVAKLTDEVEELRTRLEEATERAESAETKAATAEKWAAEAEAKAFDAVAKAEESAKEKTTDSLNAHTAIKAAEIRASEAESRALEALSKATDATEKSTKLQARIDSVREEANAVEVAAAKVVAESKQDAEDARALLDSARATADAAEASAAAIVRELKAQVADMSAQSKASETELANQSALIERLGDEVRRWRDEKTAADERAAESSLREETLRERLATASDETETLRQRLFGVTGEGNEGLSGRVLEEFQKPTESVAGSKQIPESELKSDPPASPVRNQSEEKPVPETPPASPSTFASFFGFGESPSKPPNEESNKPPATEEIPAAAESPAKPKPRPESVSGGQSDSPERRIATLSESMEDLRERHAEEADSLRERLVAAERSLEKTMVKAEERVVENRALNEEIEKVRAECARLAAETTRARGEADAAEAEVEVMLAKLSTAKPDSDQLERQKQLQLEEQKQLVEEQKQIADEKTEALAKAERDVASLEGKLQDVTRELGAAKSAAEARAEAGKDVAAVEEKFEKHKKFADEKVRALAKAESDVRALEGKLEDAARELAVAKAETAETAETAAAKAADEARTTDAGQELESLREKFEKHKKFADEKVRALAKAESDVRALEGKLERSMEESNARLAEATERASSLEREHKIAVESAAADASRARGLAEELDSARKETAETAAKLATLERTHATHATRTAELEQSLGESRLEVKAKADSAREFAGKLGELSDAKEKVEKELETARAYANKARGDSEKAAEARAETGAKARAFAEEKRAERIASMDKEHKEAVSKLEAKIQADASHIAELKETAETAAKQSEERRSALAMAQREMKRVLSDKTDADAQIAELKEKFGKHKKFTEEKVRTLAKAESDVRALEGKLEDANREIRDAKAGGDAEKAEVTELRTKTAAQAKDLWAKAKELVKAREETRRMERYKTECEDLRSRLATLQTSNETMEKELIRARVASPASSPARSGNRSGNTSGNTSAASTPHRTPRSSQSASAGASLSATPERRKETAKETAGTASGPTHARIAEISTALDAARTDASDKERRLAELSEKLRALDVSSASALAAADSSKKTIEDLTAALTEANARVNAEKQRAARLGTELATKEAERAALTAELASKPSNSAPRAATERVETERDETESVEVDELRARLRATETTLARARDDASRADVAFERYKSETHASAASAASTHAEEAESLRRKLAAFAAADSGAKKKVTVLEEKVRVADAKLVQQTAESDARLKELTVQLDRSRADSKRLKTSLAESRDAETKASAGEQKASNKKEMLRIKCEDLASRAKLAETRASTARAECTAARRAKIDAQAGEAAAAASLKSVEAKLKAANSALESHRTRELSPLVSPTKPKRSPARRFSGSGTGTTDEELLSARNDAAEARSELDKERALRVKADESAALARSDADELRRALDSAEKGDWSAVEMALKPSPAPPPAVRTRVGTADGVPGRRSLPKDFEGTNTEPIYDETSDFEDARSELSVHSAVPSRETTPRDTRGGSVSPAAASPGLAEPRSMTQFYARENESLRARVAALETQLSDSAPKDTIPGSISASDETLVKRLQDAERRANDAEAQMTGMERAHLNALTALETSGRAAADAAADEQTELASALEKIRAELVAAVAAREKAEKDAVDARKDAVASVAAARSALASTDATSPPNSPGGDSLLSPALSERSPVSRSSRTHDKRRLQSVHQSLPSAESLAASKLASERVRKRREAEARRLVQEASAKAAEDIDKKENELTELRATVAKLRADADQAVRDRSKAEAKAWEWRRALRASEKAAKDAAGLLERRDKELQERRTAEKDRRAGVESSRAHEGQGRTPLRVHRTVSSPTSATATPRHSTSTAHVSPGGDVLSPKPHPSTVESARLEAEELAMRRRLREEEFGTSPSGRQSQTEDDFNPQTTPRRSDRVVRKAATPSRRSLDLRTPPRGATPQSPVTHHDSPFGGSRQSPNNVAEAEAARLRAECAGLKSENERLAMDSSRWKDELALVADAARVEATNASAREVRRLENALAAADERARLSAAETKVLRETNQLNVHDARVQAAETEAKILRDELESLSVDLENARGDASAARAREETLAIQLVRSREISAKFQNAEVEKERLARANAKIADMTTQLGHMEDERFELRRALEAHVGALVEAKVDSAEHAGTVSELRKELARVNVKYQRAAARCAKMEAMVPARGDPTSAEYVSANVPA